MPNLPPPVGKDAAAALAAIKALPPLGAVKAPALGAVKAPSPTTPAAPAAKTPLQQIQSVKINPAIDEAAVVAKVSTDPSQAGKLRAALKSVKAPGGGKKPPPEKPPLPPAKRALLPQVAPFIGVGLWTAWDSRAALSGAGHAAWVALKYPGASRAEADTLRAAGFSILVWESDPSAGQGAVDALGAAGYIGQAESPDQLAAALALGPSITAPKALVTNVYMASWPSDWVCLAEGYQNVNANATPVAIYNRAVQAGATDIGVVLGVYDGVSEGGHRIPLRDYLAELPGNEIGYSCYLAETMTPDDFSALTGGPVVAGGSSEGAGEEGSGTDAGGGDTGSGTSDQQSLPPPPPIIDDAASDLAKALAINPLWLIGLATNPHLGGPIFPPATGSTEIGTGYEPGSIPTDTVGETLAYLGMTEIPTRFGLMVTVQPSPGGDDPDNPGAALRGITI